MATTGLVLLGLVVSIPAATAARDAAERTRIAEQRAEANTRYQAQAAECRKRFVVTACLDDAERRRRDALDDLRRQQLLLDDAERRQRAADRLDAIGTKQAAAASTAEAASARRPTVPPGTSAMRLRRPPAQASQPDDGAARADADAGAGDETVDAPPAAQPDRPAAGRPRRDRGPRRLTKDAAAESARLQRQREQQDRQADIAAHRQAVERRNADRASSGKKPAAPLPLPAGVPPSGSR